MTATVTQTGSKPEGSRAGPTLHAKSVATSIPATGNTDIMVLNVDGINTLGLAFDVTTNNLDVFTISGKFGPEDSFRSLYAAITSTPGGLIKAASGTLASTAAAGSGWVVMDVSGLSEVKVTVSGTVADTTAVTIYASGSR